MTIEQFDPKQTTTLDAPKKVLEEQASITQGKNASGSKVGFVSLGCPKGTPKDLCTLLI